MLFLFVMTSEIADKHVSLKVRCPQPKAANFKNHSFEQYMYTNCNNKGKSRSSCHILGKGGIAAAAVSISRKAPISADLWKVPFEV